MGCRRQSPITLYVDESGTGQESAATLIGGIYFRNVDRGAFRADWRNEVLKKHRIDSLHMKEFIRGKLRHIQHQQRSELFQDVAKVIKRYRCCSFSSPILAADYNTHLAPLTVKGDGITRDFMSFVLLIGGNNELAKWMKDNVTGIFNDAEHEARRVPFVMDQGGTSWMAMQNALVSVRKNRTELATLAGRLSFADDNEVFQLQAADVIAWSCRRLHAENGRFPKGFETLKELVTKFPHVDEVWKPEWLQELAIGIRQGEFSPAPSKENAPGCEPAASKHAGTNERPRQRW
jgi:Protein of unknown function (DUF3800)